MSDDARAALVLGASSGFGEATVRAFAAEGYDIYGVHLDRRSGLEHVEEIREDLEAHGVRARFFNRNAADEDKRADTLDEVLDEVGEGGLGVMLHSLAFGTLVPFVGDEPGDGVSPKQMDMTLDVMAHTLVYWTQGVVHRGLMAEGGRIFAMTSSGGDRVAPAYGPVSAAKAALESHCRQLALELADRDITVNAIRAGVTDTPALRKIPGSDVMVERARASNPHGRLTQPEDVARCMVTLAGAGTHWMTGNVIRVDGGEDWVMAGAGGGP